MTGPRVQFQDCAVDLTPGESVLDALERAGRPVPSSCRSGVCQSCLLQAIEGEVPAVSQKGLKATLANKGYFLACQCHPESDLSVALPDSVLPTEDVTVLDKQVVGRDVVQVRLSLPESFECQAGQYLHVSHADTMRSYSVASLPDVDGFLELHVRQMPGGKLSSWFFEECAPGTVLQVRGPLGSCYYLPDGLQDFPVLLAGTGTGLAPLEGIARDALSQGHTGSVTLLHGAREPDGLYHVAELQALQEAFPQFTYRQAVMSDGGDIVALAKAQVAAMGAAQARVYLCGAPELVNKLRMQLFLQGVGSAHIHADPFVTAPIPV